MTLVEDINEVFNQRRVQELLNAIGQINESVQRMATTITGVGNAAKKASEDSQDATKKAAGDLKGLTDEAVDLFAVLESNLTTFEKVKQGLSRVGEAVGGVKGGLQYLHLTQKDAQGSFESLLSTLANRSPWLRVVQMTYDAQMALEKFEAVSRKATLSFLQTGRLTEGQVIRLGEEIGHVSEQLRIAHFAAAGELEQVLVAAAVGGVTIEEAWSKSAYGVGEFGDTIAVVALKTDKAFDQVAGTTARLATDLQKNIGGSFDEAVAKIGRMGIVARETGLTMSMFVGTVNQVTSALRMQGSTAEDVGGVILKASQFFGRLYGTEGTKDLRTGQVAEQTAKDLGSLFQRPSDALVGLHGKEIVKRMYGLSEAQVSELGFKGIDYVMKTGGFPETSGLRGRRPKMGMEVAGQLAISEELYRQHPDMSETERFQLLQRSPFAGARAAPGLAALLAAIPRGATPESVQARVAESDKELRRGQLEAEKLAPLTAPKFTQVMESVENVLKAGFQSVVEGFQKFSISGSLFNLQTATARDKYNMAETLQMLGLGVGSDAQLERLRKNLETAETKAAATYGVPERNLSQERGRLAAETLAKDIRRLFAETEPRKFPGGAEALRREQAQMPTRQTAPGIQQVPTSTTEAAKLDLSRARAFLNLDDLISGGHGGELRIPIIATSSSTVSSGATPDSR